MPLNTVVVVLAQKLAALSLSVVLRWLGSRFAETPVAGAGRPAISSVVVPSHSSTVPAEL